MELKNIILSLLLIGVTTKCLVQGLQCYVCDNCNEYEDFKELHICGEIPLETTIKPISQPQQLGSELTKKPTKKPVLAEDYLDSGETHDEVSSQNLNKKTTTTVEVTEQPTTLANTSSKSTTSTEKSTTTESKTTASSQTSKATTTASKATTTASKTTTTTSTRASTAAVAVVSSSNPKPVIATDYDDYLEYEDPVDAEKRSSSSLLKMNEPVCYMIKIHVNNTVITNRGCTTFINANKYLTCQSLYNGAPMESCRVCTSNGCNKFLSDDGEDDYHGLPINAAGSLKIFGLVVLLFGALMQRFVV